MFNDRARIHVQAGRGGDGSLHFRREKHVPKGGPDGGDGGPGGDVVLVADPDLRDLSAFRARRWFRGGNGEPGRGALKHGATGETAAVRVPVGTQVFDAEERLIADLATRHARVTVAEITEKSKRWKLEQLEAALEFERLNANRKGAIAALESAIAAKQEKEG